MPALERHIEEEGIMVSFGDNIDGLGFGDMIAGEEELSAQATLPPQEAEQQELITQTRKKTVSIPKQQTKPRETKRTNDYDLQRQEQQRRETAAAAEARKKAEAIARAENLIGGRSWGDGGAGSGDTKGDSRQGNPVGSGTSGKHKWSLSGRSLIGDLIEPVYTRNVEGKITVAIRVAASGEVVSAKQSTPTDISDAQMLRAAEIAAKSTRFSSGSRVSVGTITYIFTLQKGGGN